MAKKAPTAKKTTKASTKKASKRKSAKKVAKVASNPAIVQGPPRDKPGSVRAYLNDVDLPSRAPPIAPSRLDRQLEFDEPACSLSRVSADTPVPTRHAIAATRRFSMSSA